MKRLIENKNNKIFFLTILLVLLLYILGLFNAINHKIYDQLILLNIHNKINKDILIVKIDNKSIKEIGQWPWSRYYYVDVLKTVIENDPAVIGINLEFTENKDLEGDSKLYKVLKSFPRTVLTAKLNKTVINNISLLIPQKNIFPGITEAHVYIQYTENSVIRSFPTYKHFPAFALQVLKYYYDYNNVDYKTLSPKLKSWFLQINQKNNFTSEMVLIDYKRTTEQFDNVSFIDVLNKNINPEIFKNKIVLIGLTDRSRTITHTTPYTGTKSLSCTPVELQAQIIDSLMNYRNLLKVPDWFLYLFSILVPIAFVLGMSKKTALYQGISFLIIVTILATADYILFKYLAIWFPPGLLFILLLSTFGFSMYFTTSKIDTELIETIRKYQKDDNIPLLDIPTDISSRVEVLSSLLETISTDRQTIKAIINAVNNGIIVIDESGKIIWTNERALEIFTQSIVINQNIEDLVELNLNEIKAEMEVNHIFKKELSIESFDFISIVTPIKSVKKQYVIIFNDITELKEIDRLKTDMVRMVSHELKNPLMVMQISSENIEYSDDKEEINKHNSKIFETIEIMLETINNFLNLNKLESNLIQMNIEKSDLISLLKKSIELNEPIANNKGVSVILDTSETPPVMMDKVQMNIVTNNLISNAVKYSLKNGEVKIKIKSNNDFVSVSVIDSGIGIPKEDIDKIFSKFYRSSNNKKEKIKGTGLGLSIVKRIIESHKGTISVTSEENKGSCFTFSLPKAK